MVPWLGEGILISGGKKWKHRRRLLNASFHYKILENYTESKSLISNKTIFLKLYKTIKSQLLDYLAYQLLLADINGDNLLFQSIVNTINITQCFRLLSCSYRSVLNIGVRYLHKLLYRLVVIRSNVNIGRLLLENVRKQSS